MWEYDCRIEKRKLLKGSLRLNQYNKLTKTEWQTQSEIALASASLYFALWLVKKNHTTLSTNQTEDLSQSWFSRASGSLLVFIMRSHWLLIVYSLHLIGHRDYSAFGLTTLNREALYHFHFWGWLPLRLSKGTIIMPTNPQNDTTDYNTTNLSCGKSCWFK